MKRLPISALALAITLAFFLPELRAGHEVASFEGSVSATLMRAGTDAAHLVFTRKGDLLRIENTDNKLEPINIIDLAASKLTIVYPHNTTFVKVDLPIVAGGADPGQPGPPMPLPGSTPPATTTKVGPNTSPPAGFPTPPPRPSMPDLPNKSMPPMPIGGPPGANPMVPPPPMMPGFSGKAELKKTEQTKKIQGYDCTLYTLSERGETFELWVTNDSSLFPFRLIERDFLGRHFGPQMVEETWPQLLREKSLFPLEATLKMEPGSEERLNFKVEKIERTKVENLTLFQPPEKYIEIQTPRF